VQKARNAAVVAVLLFLASLWVLMGVGITAVWLTEELKAIGLVVLPIGIVTGLLVVYFEWRTRLLNQFRDGRHEH
jgi:uncharacterized membrane protein